MTVLYVHAQRDAVCGVAVKRITSTKRFHVKITLNISLFDVKFFFDILKSKISRSEGEA